jgi:hypothetical protein
MNVNTTKNASAAPAAATQSGPSAAEKARTEILATYPSYAVQPFVEKGEQRLRIAIPVRGFAPVFAIEDGEFVPRMVNANGPHYTGEAFKTFIAKTWADADAGLMESFRHDAADKGHFSVKDGVISLPSGATYELKYGMLKRTSGTGGPAEMPWTELGKFALAERWRSSGVDKSALEALLAGNPRVSVDSYDTAVDVQPLSGSAIKYKVARGVITGPDGEAMSLEVFKGFALGVVAAYVSSIKSKLKQLAYDYPSARFEYDGKEVVVKPWEGEPKRFTVDNKGGFVPANTAAGSETIDYAKFSNVFADASQRLLWQTYHGRRDLTVTYTRPEVFQLVGNGTKWTELTLKDPDSTSRVFTCDTGRIYEIIGAAKVERSYVEFRAALDEFTARRDAQFANELGPFIAARKASMTWNAESQTLTYNNRQLKLAGAGFDDSIYCTFAEFKAMVEQRETTGLPWVSIQNRTAQDAAKAKAAKNQKIRDDMFASLPTGAVKALPRGYYFPGLVVPVTAAGGSAMFAIVDGKFVFEAQNDYEAQRVSYPEMSPEQFRAFVIASWQMTDRARMNQLALRATADAGYKVDINTRVFTVPSSTATPHTYVLQCGALTRTSDTDGPDVLTTNAFPHFAWHMQNAFGDRR